MLNLILQRGSPELAIPSESAPVSSTFRYVFEKSLSQVVYAEILKHISFDQNDKARLEMLKLMNSTYHRENALLLCQTSLLWLLAHGEEAGIARAVLTRVDVYRNHIGLFDRMMVVDRVLQSVFYENLQVSGTHSSG